MFVRKLVLIFSSITSGLFIPSQAQEPAQTETLEELVVVANRIPQPIRQIGTSVSVLTEDMLQAHGNFSLANILRLSPAIAVTRNGGMGATSALRIRGEEGFRTLTLLDLSLIHI